jgi:hypothetical protein
MEIINFSDYIKEAQIRTLDMVIDENGNLYDGQEGYPLTKGNIQMNTKSIIGTDGKNYIAGIERTGKLFSFLPIDNMGNILLDGKKVKVPIDLRTDRLYWNNKENYYNLLPITPTGWVNVKIDMEVIKKIKRFSKNFSNRIGIEGLKDRLKLLTKDTKYRPTRSTKSIQMELSAIMMLHHLNELKTHFDPSSAGFLFESYVAGLIPGSFVREDNSSIDLEDKTGKTYQIKLLDSVSGLPIRKDESGEYLDYYIISFKYADKISIFILDGKDSEKPEYVENFKSKPYRREGKLIDSNNFSDANFRKYNQSNCNFVYDLSLINIQDKIDNIARGLKETLDKLYKNLSEFQYNVETILTGVDQKGNILEPDEFSKLESSSERNVIIMKDELRSLISIIRK